MRDVFLLLLLLPTGTHATYPTLATVAGYDFEWAGALPFLNMDTYLANMSTLAKIPDATAVMEAYETVDPITGYSIATLAPVPIPSQPYASLTNAYWRGSVTYSDEFTRDAILGTGPVVGWDATSRRELLTKGAAYQVVRQHIIYRLRKGIDDCSAATHLYPDLDPGVGTGHSHAHGASGGPIFHNHTEGLVDWEIAYALHSGSLEGSDGSGKGASTYALADKRCPQFNTCVGSTLIATPNAKALTSFINGRHELEDGDCLGAVTAYEEIVTQLTVPLVQGMLREAWEVDPNGGAATADGVVEVAEGWAFTAAVLPQVAECDPAASSLIEQNMALSLTNANGAHVGSGFVAVKAAIESVYPCLKMTCADVGAMIKDGAAIPGWSACIDDDGSAHHDEYHTHQGGTISALAILLGVAVLVGLAALAYARVAMRRTRAQGGACANPSEVYVHTPAKETRTANGVDEVSHTEQA